MDEHDSDDPMLEIINDQSILVDARLEIEKLEEYLNVTFPKGEFESVGGFIIHLLGRIPDVKENISFEDLEITVQKADQRKINKVLITRRALPNPPQ
jgi:CBS domain containing-hemolysin-like protein